MFQITTGYFYKDKVFLCSVEKVHGSNDAYWSVHRADGILSFQQAVKTFHRAHKEQVTEMIKEKLQRESLNQSNN